MVRVLGALALVAAATAVVGSASPQASDAYLRGVIGLSASAIKRVRAGEAVATSLAGRDGREVVSFGAVRITTPPEQVLAFLGSLEALRQGPAVRQLGLVNAPPQPDDLAEFAMEAKSIAGLQACKVGNCELQLPGWAIAKFATGVPWSTSGAHTSAQAIARSVGLETLRVYQRGGHRALVPYEDRWPPTSPSDEYTRLLGTAEYLPAPLTAVRDSVHRFPNQPAEGVRDLFYWAIMDYGMKPTFRLSHMAIAGPGALGDPSGHLAGAAVSLQILSTHYYSSTIEWHLVLKDPEDPAGSHLYYLSRSWAPGLTGIRGRVSRFTIRNRGEEGIRLYLSMTKRRLERGR